MSLPSWQSNEKTKSKKASCRLSAEEKKEKKSRKKINENKKKEALLNIKKQKKEQKIKRTEEGRNQKIKNKLNKERSFIKDLSKSIISWLDPEHINKIAIGTGYIKKLNPKIPPLYCILVFAYGFFGEGDSTLNMLAGNMSTWFNINITAQALCARISKKETANFFKKVLTQAMAQQLLHGFNNQYATLFSNFTSVQIEDSTQFQLNKKVQKKFKGSGGSASKSSMKLNIVYNITKHLISAFDIVSGADSDQSLSKNVRKRIEKGELWIRDLGYFNIVDMQQIGKIGGYFLSRLKKSICVFLKEEDLIPISIYQFLEEKTKGGANLDETVYIGQGKSRIGVRIVAEKVPEEVKQQRINSYKKNKIKRDNKKKMAEDYVEWSGYSIFITNAGRFH